MTSTDLLSLCRQYDDITPTTARNEREELRAGAEADRLIALGGSEGFRSELSAQSAEMWGVPWPRSMEDLRTSRPLARADGAYTVKMKKYPFAKGGVRLAYRAELNGPEGKKQVILKEFIIPHYRKEECYKDQSENSAYAAFLAEKYMESRGHRATKRVKAIPSRVLKIGSGGSVRYFNVEEQLSGGHFIRWTNNIGWKKPDGIHSELLGLSKWTHDSTRGYLMLTDMQGVETTSEIILTDPAILCSDDRRFQPTNTGQPGMRLCYEVLGHTVSSSAPISVMGTIRRPGFSHADSVTMSGLMRRPPSRPSLPTSSRPSLPTTAESRLGGHSGHLTQSIEPGYVDMGSGFGMTLVSRWSCCGKKERDPICSGSAVGRHGGEGRSSGGAPMIVMGPVGPMVLPGGIFFR